MKEATLTRDLLNIYSLLDGYFGNQNWWPADSVFEVIVGSILTQNTAWKNVIPAIENLKAADCLSPQAIYDMERDKLALLIRPSGYFNIKAQRLKNFTNFLYENYAGSLDLLTNDETTALRAKLLGVVGIGEETADSILLYACQKPVFVVDAYTKRIFSRHCILPEDLSYAKTQSFFMQHLPAQVNLFNQYHALIVNTGKTFCMPKRNCQGCPLEAYGIIKGI